MDNNKMNEVKDKAVKVFEDTKNKINHLLKENEKIFVNVVDFRIVSFCDRL